MIIDMRTLVIILFTILSCTAYPALAQLDANSITDPQLGIDLEPTIPKPGEQVIAKLNDYSGGVYGANITWKLNGKEILEANNQRQISFTAGEAGEPQVIEIVLTKPSGGKETIRSVIRPVYLDLIIEPQTRVPDFYLGRSLPSIGSIVNVTALVSGVKAANSQLIYTWKLNQQVIEGGSLRGGNKVSFPTPRGESSVLSLQIADLGGDLVASRAILIPSVEPKIYFYEINSLLGVSQKPYIGDIPFIGNSISIKAEPFNLDSRVYNDPDIIEWEIDRMTANNTGANPYEVTLKRVRESGVSQLKFHVRDTKQVLQGAQTTIQIKY